MEFENITLLAAFMAGLVSFLSPCVVPLLPVYSAMLAGAMEEEKGNWQIYLNAVCFLSGFTFIFVTMGATASLLGQWFFAHQPEIRKIGAVLMVVMGISLSGVLRINLLQQEYRPFLSRSFHGPFGAFLLGMAFTVGWTPCTGPVLASILLYASGNITVVNGSWLLFVYSMGFAIPFFVIAVILRQYIGHVREFYEWLPRIQQITGSMLVIIGVLMWLDWIQKVVGFLLSVL